MHAPDQLPPSPADAAPAGSGNGKTQTFLFVFALAGMFWKPSGGLADALLVACGCANARLPHAFRPWGSLAGLALLAGCAVLAVSSAFGFFPAGSFRDAVKLLPLAVFLSTLPAWLARDGNLFRAAKGAAAVLTARLAVELVRLALANGSWAALLREARMTQPYLFTHPNVSSMAALMAFWVWAAAFLKAERPAARWLSALGAATCLLFAWVMGSRGPQAAFAAVAVCVVPLLFLPGWKTRALWSVLAAAAILPCAWALEMEATRKPADVPPAAQRIRRVLEAVNPRFGDVATLRHLHGREVVWSHVDYLLETQGRTWRGYGFGKRAFQKAYYENPSQRPPRMARPVFFPHAHSYFRQIRFAGGNGALFCFLFAWFAALGGGLAAFVRRRRARGEKGCARGAEEAMVLSLAALVLAYGGWDYPDSLLLVLQYLVFAALLALPVRAKQLGS